LTHVPLGKYLKKLVGKNDIEDALKRLDRLTQEEARMVTAEVLKITHGVDDKAKVLIDGIQMSQSGPPSFPNSLYDFSNWNLAANCGRDKRDCTTDGKRGGGCNAANGKQRRRR